MCVTGCHIQNMKPEKDAAVTHQQHWVHLALTFMCGSLT